MQVPSTCGLGRSRFGHPVEVVIEALTLVSIGLGAALGGFAASGRSQLFVVLSVAGTVASFVASVLLRHWTESLLENWTLTSSPREAVWGVFAIMTLVWLLGLAGGWLTRERMRASSGR